MIDIKAIREAAESTPNPWPMSLQPNTVIALCDEIERLRTPANAGCFGCETPEKCSAWGCAQKMPQYEVEHQEGLIKALEAQVANQQKHLLRQDAELERLRKDAERYRLIRDADMNFRNRAEHYSWLALDEFLDAAMESK